MIADKTKTYAPSEAGNKKALVKSGAYPFEFGLAVSSLVPTRQERPEGTMVDLKAYHGIDHLGALDDFNKGRAHAWWRELL